jgi:alkylation response protein AidB-like acyl-CoA dehydrogenase
MSGMVTAPVLDQARQIAEDVLFPAAMAVDAADHIPPGHFAALADAGFYGLAGPAAAGGTDTDLATFCAVIEIMASGCLATAFVWLQHHSTVRALAASANSALSADWLEPLCRGDRRAGVALGGVRPGPPLLRARPQPDGWIFDGTAPWVTGWDMIDVVHAYARDEAGNLVTALLPATATASLEADPLDLVAVNASRTVELRFAEHFVPAELVSAVMPYAQWPARDAAGLRPNGSLALGVASRCSALIAGLGASAAPGPGAVTTFPGDALAAQLAVARGELDAAGIASMPAARAAAAELAFRAAGALVAAAGSRSILAGQHPQRLAREALFLLVFGSRPAIRERLIAVLAR